MFHYCCVPHCIYSWAMKDPGISFHEFPREGLSKIIVENKLGNRELVDRRKVWMKALKIGKKISYRMRVCSLHFSENDFFHKGYKEKENRRTLKKNAVPTKNLRLESSPPSRDIQKARKVFDPSDTHIPKKRGRPRGSLNRKTYVKKLKRNEDASPELLSSAGSSKDQGGVCSVCRTQSKRSPHDRMVACRECSTKAHYGCLNSDDMMLKLNPDNTWRCPHCKTCVECFETSNAGNLIVCAVCADAYHATCHQPEITDKIEKGQKWLCVNCQATKEMGPDDFQANIGESFNFQIRTTKTKKSDKTIRVSPNLKSKTKSASSSSNNSPPSSPSQSDSSSDEDSDNENSNSDHSECTTQEVSNRYPDKEIDPSIPDVTKWTPDDLYKYFRQFLTHDEAKVFKEQEIDGRSFLLLRRIDVLTHLNLMLGPALKVYRHLTMLQVRRDDKSLYWL